MQRTIANHPEISHSDLWVAAGAAAVEFLGGPKVPFNFGRIDVSNDKSVPPNGRLPDAAQVNFNLFLLFFFKILHIHTYTSIIIIYYYYLLFYREHNMYGMYFIVWDLMIVKLYV